MPNKLSTNTEIFDSFLAYITAMFAMIVSILLIMAATWQGFIARNLNWGYIDLVGSLILMLLAGWLAKQTEGS